MSDASSQIQDKMQAIRQRKRRRMDEVKNEATRLVDWREHVKAAPIAALVASVVVGFMLFRRQSVVNHSPPIAHSESKNIHSKPQPSGFTVVDGLKAFVLQTAVMFGKQYATNQLTRLLRSLHHEHDSTPGPNSTFKQRIRFPEN